MEAYINLYVFTWRAALTGKIHLIFCSVNKDHFSSVASIKWPYIPTAKIQYIVFQVEHFLLFILEFPKHRTIGNLLIKKGNFRVSLQK